MFLEASLFSRHTCDGERGAGIEGGLDFPAQVLYVDAELLLRVTIAFGGCALQITEYEVIVWRASHFLVRYSRHAEHGGNQGIVRRLHSIGSKRSEHAIENWRGDGPCIAVAPLNAARLSPAGMPAQWTAPGVIGYPATVASMIWSGESIRFSRYQASGELRTRRSGRRVDRRSQTHDGTLAR